MNLYICERQQAVKSLSLVLQMVKKSKVNIYYWRWVIISLQCAVQEFMVLWTQTFDEALIYNDNSREIYQKARNENQALPDKLQMLGFKPLYEQTKNSFKEKHKFEIGEKLNLSITKLGELRNEFTHFKPQGLGLSVYGLPMMCIQCLDFVELLGWKKTNAFQGSFEFKDEAERYVYFIRKEIAGLGLAYQNIKSAMD